MTGCGARGCSGEKARQSHMYNVDLLGCAELGEAPQLLLEWQVSLLPAPSSFMLSVFLFLCVWGGRLRV